jgi:hypothetical protein
VFGKATPFDVGSYKPTEAANRPQPRGNCCSISAAILLQEIEDPAAAKIGILEN